MARGNIPIQEVSRTGLEIDAGGSETTGDAVNGHYFANSGKEMLYVRNSGGAEYDVTLIIGKTVDGVTVDPKVVAVGAGEMYLLGPFPEQVYDQETGTEKGQMQVDVENAALMLMAIRFNV